MRQPSPAFAPAPVYKFGQLIEAFRGVYRAGRTQFEIMAQALTYKRQLESLGMFPGLMAGTKARLTRNGRDGIIGYDDQGEPMYGRLTRGDLKRLARAQSDAKVSETRDPPHHYHGQSRGVSHLPAKLIGPTLRPGDSVVVRTGMAILDEAYGNGIPHSHMDDGRLTEADMREIDAARCVSPEDRGIIEAAMAAPVPAYEPGIVSGYNFAEPYHVTQDVETGEFRVFEHMGGAVAGPYKDRKTANRRAKQLNAKAA